MPSQDTLKIAAIVQDAGGRIVGRTRLQKVAYLLTVAGLESGLSFTYKHYGPFSEDVATAARLAHLLGHIQEEEHQASWGGSYSIFTTALAQSRATSLAEVRREFVSLAAEADAIELELAATAVYLAQDGAPDPWAETEKRKPEKAIGDHIKNAKSLLQRLRAVHTPKALPAIA